MTTEHQILGNHIKICRQDGITWGEIQAVKNEMVGEDVCCIEVYPPEAMVNEEKLCGV